MEKWRNSLFLALITAGTLTGCAPAITRAPVGQSQQYVQPLPISAAEVETRMARLAKILERTKMSERERQVATDLLNSYQMIGATLQPPMTEGDRQRVIRLLFETLTRTDEQYFAREKIDEGSPLRGFDQYLSKRKEIIQGYLAADYQKVVNECIGLESMFGQEALSPEIGLLFSISLAKQGRLREAIGVGEKVVREMETKPDLLNLRAYILEWQLAMGLDRNAEAGFQELMRGVAEKENLLLEARQRLAIPLKDEAAPAITPEPPASSEVAEEASVPQVSESLQGPLAEVRELTKRREFTKAKFILLQQRIRFPEGPETGTIDEAMRSVELAEEKGIDGPETSDAPMEAEKLALAKKLIEEENFDEALAKLAEFQNGSLQPEIQGLKDTATEKVINRDRNRAAKLYLMARNETNPRKKEELLISSLNILKALLDKYPSSPLKKKINENMATIKDEMGRLKKRTE